MTNIVNYLIELKQESDYDRNIILNNLSNINIEYEGKTVLHIAFQRNFMNIIKDLVNLGADPNITYILHRICLRYNWTIQDYNQHLSIFEILIQKADVNIQNESISFLLEEGNTLLHLVWDENIFSLLLLKNPNVYILNNYNRTPLIHHLKLENTPDYIVSNLIKLSILQDKDKFNRLYKDNLIDLIINGNICRPISLIYALDAGCNINIDSETGKSPLHLAAFKNISTYINILLKYQGNYQLKDYNNLYPLDYCVAGSQCRKILKNLKYK